MLQVIEEFNKVNLEALKNIYPELNTKGNLFVYTLVGAAIAEIEMHRKFNKQRSEYLSFVNEEE